MLKLIVVDDEERIRLGIAKILAKSGREVEVVGSFANGLQAIEHMMRMTPGEVDLVMTDIKMPVVDGLKLIGQLRQKHPQLKFVIVSGFNDFAYARQAIQFGVMDYLLKPIDLQALNDILDRVEQEKKAGNEEAGSPLAEEGEERFSHRVIETIKARINEHYSRNINLPDLAEEVFVNPYHLSKLFRKTTGETITDYIIRVRIAKAKQLLELHPELKVFEVGRHVGYDDAAYFNKLFKKVVGVTPKEFKDKAKYT